VYPANVAPLVPPRPPEDYFLLAPPQQLAHMLDAERDARRPSRRRATRAAPALGRPPLPPCPAVDGLLLARPSPSPRVATTVDAAKPGAATSSARRTRRTSRVKVTPLLHPCPAEDRFLLARSEVRPYVFAPLEGSRLC